MAHRVTSSIRPGSAVRPALVERLCGLLDAFIFGLTAHPCPTAEPVIDNGVGRVWCPQEKDNETSTSIPICCIPTNNAFPSFAVTVFCCVLLPARSCVCAGTYPALNFSLHHLTSLSRVLTLLAKTRWPTGSHAGTRAFPGGRRHIETLQRPLPL
jgi:hypothetical protein